jgi:hypothetical protein
LSCDNFVDPKATRRVPLLVAFLFAQKWLLDTYWPRSTINKLPVNSKGRTGARSIIMEVKAQNIPIHSNINKNNLSRVISKHAQYLTARL